MRADPRPGGPINLDDDQLGTISVALVVAELQWTPDVAPAVMDRISRDAVAYPEQFDRRPRPESRAIATREGGGSMARTMTRVVVIAVIILLVAALIVVAVSSEASLAAVALAPLVLEVA